MNRKSFLKSLLAAVALSPAVCRMAARDPVKEMREKLYWMLSEDQARDEMRKIVKGSYDGLPPYTLAQMKGWPPLIEHPKP